MNKYRKMSIEFIRELENNRKEYLDKVERGEIVEDSDIIELKNLKIRLNSSNDLEELKELWDKYEKLRNKILSK